MFNCSFLALILYVYKEKLKDNNQTPDDKK